MKMLIFLFVIVGGMMRAEAQDMYASLGKEEVKPKEITGGEVRVIERYQWEFWSAEEEGMARNCSKAIETLYGKEVGSLLTFMDERFVRKDRVDAGDPSLHTSIRKPGVYNAVKNIEKYYKRKSKAGLYTAADQEVFAYVVRVALACVDSEKTEEFEQALQDNRKNTEKQINCFCRVKLKNIYE